MDKIKRNNAIYIAFLSISIAIMAVIIIIPMVQSMRYVRHTVDYNSIVAMGSYHIKISNATYLKDKRALLCIVGKRGKQLFREHKFKA